MILRFVRPVSSALPGGQDNGHYDQHGKQAHVGKNATAGCRRPSEQDEPKNTASNRDRPEKHPPPFRAHGMAPPMPALGVTSAPPGIVEGGWPCFPCFPIPFRNCGCPVLAFFARAGTMLPVPWGLLCPADCIAPTGRVARP